MRTFTAFSGALVALALALAPTKARADDIVFAGEFVGGYGHYIESCCDGGGFSLGGAVQLGTGGEDFSIGGRVQTLFTRTKVDVLGIKATTKSLNVTVGPYVEIGQRGSFTGYGYLGMGLSHLDGNLGAFTASADGFAIALGAGGRAYFTDQVYFVAGLDLTRGYGDADALHFTFNGGIGASFE